MNKLLSLILLLVIAVFAKDVKFSYKGAFSGVYSTSKMCPVYTMYASSPKLDPNVKRETSFWYDDTIPTAKDSHYNKSGFDRGHMVPAEDMSMNILSEHKSFSMANICPQYGRFNRVTWASLENSLRDSTAKNGGGNIWTGPLYREVVAPKFKSIVVPSHFFKVYCFSGKCSAWVYKNDTTLKQNINSTRIDLNLLKKETKLNFK